MMVNGSNDYNDSSFNEMCEKLENGETISVYIDCIGHTRNNMVQEEYREKLVEKYGERLTVINSEGWISYHYEYKIK